MLVSEVLVCVAANWAYSDVIKSEKISLFHIYLPHNVMYSSKVDWLRKSEISTTYISTFHTWCCAMYRSMQAWELNQISCRQAYTMGLLSLLVQRHLFQTIGTIFSILSEGFIDARWGRRSSIVYGHDWKEKYVSQYKMKWAWAKKNEPTFI